MKVTGTRRQLLRAAGVGLALPLLESVSRKAVSDDVVAAPNETAPQRFVAINIPLGFYGPSFFPTETGLDYAMTPTLKPLEPVRDRMTVISGCSHPGVDGGHSAEASFLTAAPHPGDRNFRNTISFDQYLAGQIGDRTRFASLTLGHLSLSWSANGVSIPTENRPDRTFAKLFLRGSQQDIARERQRLQNGHSILDVVLDDAKSMRPDLSHIDRQKLEQYFAAVRGAEKRLAKAEMWSKTEKPQVNAEMPPTLPSEDLTGRLKLHFDVIHLALQTDSTRVVALGGNNGSLVPPIQGVKSGYHSLSHHGQSTEMIKQLQAVDLETVRVWGEFVKRLRETPEDGETLLDRTHILFGSNLGNANAHTTNNLPLILAGGRYKHAGHIAFDSRQNEPLANAFVTIGQSIGVPMDSFATSTGTVKGVESTSPTA